MTPGRSTTLIVEPDFNGHHLQSVSWVAGTACHEGPVVLLTSVGAAADDAFGAYLADDVAAGRIEVREVFDDIKIPTEQVVRETVRLCASPPEGAPVRDVLLMEADQVIKRWWLAARGPLRSLSERPTITFMLTRYPARVQWADWQSWRLKLPKAVLIVAARLTGTLDRVAAYAGRDQTSPGRLVRWVRDPEFSTAHARDRAQWRELYDLPADRRIAGIFGVIYERKNAPMVLEAIEGQGLDADLLLAGSISEGVQAWIDDLAPERRERLIVRNAYLSNTDLDRLVAAVDVVPLPLTLNGPSGIMGKAEVSGVPVVTAGSVVRAAEVEALGAGLACDLDAASLGRAMGRVLDGSVPIRTGQADPWAAVDRYVATLLGLDPAEAGRRRQSVQQ